jgi:para-aminobenzoate synthetase component 1
MREINLSSDNLVLRLLALEPSRKLALLDSCNSPLGDSRHLIAGFDPTESFEFRCQNKTEAENALRFLDEQLQKYRNDEFDFLGGGACVATVSYEFGMLFENLTPRSKEFQLFDFPSVNFDFYETLVVHDYKTQKTFVVGKQVEGVARELEEAQDFLIHKQSGIVSLKSNFSKSEYMAAVETIREHIAAGDIYQANLTQHLILESEEDFAPETVFWNLRKSHPAPFAAFVRRENDSIVSASPERFFKVENNKITASPIKGTRRRGKTADEDSLLRLELQQSAKDRAENVMIVDLLRNDIGRVCEFGSVRVEKLCEIEQHPTLFHLVSTVGGRLRENIKASDLLKAAFPCGSITGAPKVRAMQILDRIETAPRGISMGAIGYFGFDGSIDLNVAIRTAVVRENQAVFNVGGGIVFDSQPEAEYEESLIKARALLNSFGAI